MRESCEGSLSLAARVKHPMFAYVSAYQLPSTSFPYTQLKARSMKVSGNLGVDMKYAASIHRLLTLCKDHAAAMGQNRSTMRFEPRIE